MAPMVPAESQDVEGTFDVVCRSIVCMGRDADLG